MIGLLVLLAIAAAIVAATLVVAARDGYRALPTNSARPTDPARSVAARLDSQHTVPVSRLG